MSEAPPYSGPVEALTVEAAAARCYCSGPHLLSVYDGPRLYMGEGDASMLRIPAWALHEWLAKRAFTPGAVSGGSAWDRVADDKETPKERKAVPARQRREAK